MAYRFFIFAEPGVVPAQGGLDRRRQALDLQRFGERLRLGVSLESFPVFELRAESPADAEQGVQLAPERFEISEGGEGLPGALDGLFVLAPAVIFGGEDHLAGGLLAPSGPLLSGRGLVGQGGPHGGQAKVLEGGVVILPIEGVPAELELGGRVPGGGVGPGLGLDVEDPGADVRLRPQAVRSFEGGLALRGLAQPDEAMSELLVDPGRIPSRTEGLFEYVDGAGIVAEPPEGIDQPDLGIAVVGSGLQPGLGFDEAVDFLQARPGQLIFVVGFESSPEETGRFVVIGPERAEPAEVVEGVAIERIDVHGLLVVQDGFVDPSGVVVDRAEDVVAPGALGILGQPLLGPLDGFAVVLLVLVAAGDLEMRGDVPGIDLQDPFVGVDGVVVGAGPVHDRAGAAEDRLETVHVLDEPAVLEGGLPAGEGGLEFALLPEVLGPEVLLAGPAAERGLPDPLPDRGIARGQREGLVELGDGVVVVAGLVPDLADGHVGADVGALPGQDLVLPREIEPPADADIGGKLGRQGLEQGAGVRVVAEGGVGVAQVAPDFDGPVPEVAGLLELGQGPVVQTETEKVHAEGPPGRDILFVLLEHADPFEDVIDGLDPALGPGVVRVDKESLVVLREGLLELPLGDQPVSALHGRPGEGGPFSASPDGVAP